MNIQHAALLAGSRAMAAVSTPEGLKRITAPDCAGVIWDRQPLPDFQGWLDDLNPGCLPTERAILRPAACRAATAAACIAAGMPKGPERTHLVDDIAALADVFSALMRAPFLRLRLERVTTNACRKFHVDTVRARLICTYRGTGTQYGISADGRDPEPIFTAGTGMPMVLRGALWPETPRASLVHRSPPIEATGETRLVLVLDPIFDEGAEG